jgi:hypothetical protein
MSSTPLLTSKRTPPPGPRATGAALATASATTKFRFDVPGRVCPSA